MWSEYKYFILAGLAFIAIGVMESLKPKETVWIESYSKFDKIPYGNYVLYNELESIFSDPVTSSYESLKSSLSDTLINTNLLIINNSFDASESDINALLNYVNRGNQAMIISRKITDKLLDTLNLSIDFEFSEEIETEISHLISNDTTQYSGPTFNIYFRSYFDEIASASPIGYRSDSLINFVSVNYGEGLIYLHVLPSAFTNAFMLSKNNHGYVSKVLSYLPDQPTIWDEYFKARKNYIKKTPLQQLLATDGLRQAFYLLLLGTLIYMIFASKRRQRSIPVLPIKSNSTVEFIQTMGQLYYNESDHKDIGVKRVNYFLADIRERYRLETETLNEEFCSKLSILSGVPRDDIDRLIKNFTVINTVAVVLDIRIKEQDKLIENYYKKERAYGK